MPDLSWIALVPRDVYIVAAGLVITFRYFAPRIRKGVQLFDDIVGEPARDGVEARPGVLHRTSTNEQLGKENAAALQQLSGRVERIEVRQTQIFDAVDAIRGQVTPNSGSSMNDKVDELWAEMRERRGDDRSDPGAGA